MGMYKVVNLDDVPSFKAIAFLGSKIWNIENLILTIQVQECVGEFQAWSLCMFLSPIYDQ